MGGISKALSICQSAGIWIMAKTPPMRPADSKIGNGDECGFHKMSPVFDLYTL